MLFDLLHYLFPGGLKILCPDFSKLLKSHELVDNFLALGSEVFLVQVFFNRCELGFFLSLLVAFGLPLSDVLLHSLGRLFLGTLRTFGSLFGLNLQPVQFLLEARQFCHVQVLLLSKSRALGLFRVDERGKAHLYAVYLVATFFNLDQVYEVEDEEDKALRIEDEKLKE